MFWVYHPRATYVNRIARELGVSTVYPRHNRDRRRRLTMSVVVNWGCAPSVINRLSTDVTILNRDISGARTKMRTFELLDAANLPHPRVSRDPRELYERGRYLGRADGLTGGAGIVVYEKGALPDENVVHDFYSQVVSKAQEVRIHVAGGQIICEQIKYIPRGSGVLVRNYDNGARFTTVGLDQRIPLPLVQTARDIAIKAVAACGLDFGALDMALTRNNEWVIFEVNSAPGLSIREDDGTNQTWCTYEAYLAYFRGFVNA